MLLVAVVILRRMHGVSPESTTNQQPATQQPPATSSP
jgi:hypothetical protein